MIRRITVRLTEFIRVVSNDLSTTSHDIISEKSRTIGHEVCELLTDADHGVQKALFLALDSGTSVIFDYNRYRVVISNPKKAVVSTVGAGGIVVTDGENSIFFDTVSREFSTDGEVHFREPFYWDLGARDEEDGVFIVRQVYDAAGRIPDADTV